MNKRSILAAILLAGLSVVVTWSQYRRTRPTSVDDSEGGIQRTQEGDTYVDENTMHTAREVPTHSEEVPMWTNRAGFEKDVFTFCRLAFNLKARGGKWTTDFPDSDLSLSYRLQQVTSLKVSPEGRFLRLKNKDLYDYPWIYMVEPGKLGFDEEEVVTLRKYLQNGGFVMADDFWGNRDWENFEEEFKRVLPDRQFVELPMEHPVFHCVFDLPGPKEKLQTPNLLQGLRSLDPNSPDYGITWEYYHRGIDPETTREMHVRAILDDKGRIMVIATHNCDNGDGWEREGSNDGFFHEFSEKRAFPLGINIIVYAMTH